MACYLMTPRPSRDAAAHARRRCDDCLRYVMPRVTCRSTKMTQRGDVPSCYPDLSRKDIAPPDVALRQPPASSYRGLPVARLHARIYVTARERRAYAYA